MEKILEVYNNLIRSQFEYGGKKYASDTQEKEATDILFDYHSHKWLIGTIDKYTFRFKNLQRERDLLKIATYMYLIWLKRGFHISSHGFELPINTNIEIKTNNFNKFLGFYNSYIETNTYLTSMEVNDIMQLIHEQMTIWSAEPWESIGEENIYEVYNLTFVVWNKLYSAKAGLDQDINNEEKK